MNIERTETMLMARVDPVIAERFASVLAVAELANEHGVIDWAERAAEDAATLGRLRARDEDTLERLERTFTDEFYSQFQCRGEPAYAYA